MFFTLLLLILTQLYYLYERFFIHKKALHAYKADICEPPIEIKLSRRFSEPSDNENPRPVSFQDMMGFTFSHDGNIPCLSPTVCNLTSQLKALISHLYFGCPMFVHFSCLNVIFFFFMYAHMYYSLLVVADVNTNINESPCDLPTLDSLCNLLPFSIGSY